MRFSAEDMSFIAHHLKSIEKHPSDRYKAIITCDNAASVNKIAPMLVLAYFGDNWKYYDDMAHTTGVITFDRMYKRDDAVTDLRQKVANYVVSHPDEFKTTENEIAQPDEDEDQKKPDWLTYAIIGLAAVALILLIIPKRKK